jgi:hypothetical protein
MKYVHSNGRRMVVRDIGPELWEATAHDQPLTIVTHEIMSDDEARRLVAEVKNNKHYTSRKVGQ